MAGFEFEFTFGAEADGGLPATGWSFAFGDSGGGEPRTGCAAGSCPHPAVHPAEADWERLVSAVPVPGQSSRLRPRCEGMAYPADEDFAAAVAAVRPVDPDAHAFATLRGLWTGEVAERLSPWPRRLRSKLAGLSGDWAGDDFDAFAVQIDTVRTLIEGVLDDVEAAATALSHQEEAVYALQGGDSGEVPYPGALVGFDGEWSELVAVHVRPAWWQGDCLLLGCAEVERALLIAGADPDLASQVREFIEQRTGAGLSGLGAVFADVRQVAGEEARERFGARVEAELAAYAQRHAAVDESIAQKTADQGAEIGAFAPGAQERPYPLAADRAHMALSEPPVSVPAASARPHATREPTLAAPGGGGVEADPDEAADDEEIEDVAWETVDDEPTPSGGLASGGPGGLGGGGSLAAAGAVSGGSAPGGPPGSVTTTTHASAPPSGAGGARGAGMVAGAPGSPAAVRQQGRGQEAKGGEESEDDAGPTRRETENVWGWVPRDQDLYS